MDLGSVESPSGDDDGGAAPLVVGQKKQRVPLWINEDWRPDNQQPLLEDRERGVAYWFDVEDIENLVQFVKAKSR